LKLKWRSFYCGDYGSRDIEGDLPGKVKFEGKIRREAFSKVVFSIPWQNFIPGSE